MSHAQIPAMQWFWGVHGLVLETSIWLLAESTRSQLILCCFLFWLLWHQLVCIFFSWKRKNACRWFVKARTNQQGIASMPVLLFGLCFDDLISVFWWSSKCFGNRFRLTDKKETRFAANQASERRESATRRCRHQQRAQARSSVSAICLRFRGWSCKAAKRNVTHTNRWYVQRLRVCSFLLAFLWLLRKSLLLVAFKKVFAQTRIFKRQRNNTHLFSNEKKTAGFARC